MAKALVGAGAKVYILGRRASVLEAAAVSNSQPSICSLRYFRHDLVSGA